MRRQIRRHQSGSMQGMPLDSGDSSQDDLSLTSYGFPAANPAGVIGAVPGINEIGKARRPPRRRRRRKQQSSIQMNALLIVATVVMVLMFLGSVAMLKRETKNHNLSSIADTSAAANAAVEDFSLLAGQEHSHADASSHKQFQRMTDSAPSCLDHQSMHPDEVTYTLVTQLSDDRLWMMRYHCDRWGDQNQMSIAVLSNRTKDQVRSILVDEYACNDSLLTLEVVRSNEYPTSDYPVNMLRNLALKNVVTSHVLLLDVDFWESTDLAETLMEPHVRGVLAANPKQVLVVPAFQLARQCRQWKDCREKNVPAMPKSKLALIQLIKDHKASQFDPTNRGGHGSTRYKEWLHQDAASLLPIDCVTSNRYEPFLVFRYCKELPPFQQAFSGYGKNKMTWMMFILRLGYELQQVGGVFVIHYPHLDSPSRMKWNEAPSSRAKAAWNVVKDGSNNDPSHDAQSLMDFKRGQVDETFVQFRKWLHETIPDEAKVLKCDDAADDDAKLWVERGEHYEED